MGEPGVGEDGAGEGEEEEELLVEEEGGGVDTETTVEGVDDELVAGLGFPALILAAALSTAAHKLSVEPSSKPCLMTETRRPHSAEFTMKISGIAPASAVNTVASSAAVKPSNRTPSRPA